MKTAAAEASPQLWARIGGVLYVIVIVLGAVGELAVRGSIVVPGDAAATASNLRSMESLWRFGIASELFLGICTTVYVLILYILLRPVNKDLALLATFFGLVAMAVEIAYSLHLVEALVPLGNAEYLKGFTPEQLNAMASMSIRAHSQGFGIALLFFGCVFPVAGYLVFKSGYFPKWLGIVYIIPGVSYLASSFSLILAPAFAAKYYFLMAGPAGIGELVFSLWLLVKGVDVRKWNERVNGSQA